MNDVFDQWWAKKPPHRQTTLMPWRGNAYREWTEENEIGRSDPNYDTVGAFESGQNVDATGHLGSIGREGKLLKSPDHPTAWKTAAVEMLMGKVPAEQIEGVLGLGRERAAEIVMGVVRAEAERWLKARESLR